MATGEPLLGSLQDRTMPKISTCGVCRLKMVDFVLSGGGRGVIAFRVLLTPDWVLLTPDWVLLPPDFRSLTAPVYQINSFNAIQVTRAFVQGK